MIKKVKKGDAFLCVKDYQMDDNRLAYKHSKVYYVGLSEEDGYFNMPDESERFHSMKIDTDFLDHFMPWNIPLEVTDSPSIKESYDFVNPNHYKSFTKEVIDMMVDIWGKEAVATHCEITAFKYRMRLGNKPDQPIERDLEKAKWYEAKANELKKQYNEQKDTSN